MGLSKLVWSVRWVEITFVGLFGGLCDDGR